MAVSRAILTADVTTVGVQDLARALMELGGERLLKKAMTFALNKGAGVLKAQVVSNIHSMMQHRSTRRRRRRDWMDSSGKIRRGKLKPPLARTIIVKKWDKPEQKMWGRIVGAKYGYGGGPHAHLVERGHRLVGHRPGRRVLGGMTRAIWFQRRAQEQTKQQQIEAIREKLKQMLDEAKRKAAAG